MHSNNDEIQLGQHLLKIYHELSGIAKGRPVANASEAMYVGFGITLVQLVDIDEDSNIASVIAWDKMVGINLVSFNIHTHINITHINWTYIACTIHGLLVFPKRTKTWQALFKIASIF